MEHEKMDADGMREWCWDVYVLGENERHSDDPSYHLLEVLMEYSRKDEQMSKELESGLNLLAAEAAKRWNELHEFG